MDDADDFEIPEDPELEDGGDGELDDSGELDDGDETVELVAPELLAAVLSDPEALKHAHDKGLDPNLLQPENYIEAYRDILSFYAKHRKPMTLSIFRDRWPDLPVAEEFRDIEYIINDVTVQAKQAFIGKYTTKAHGLLYENMYREENLDQVVDIWREGLSEHGKLFVSVSDRVKPFSREDFAEHYLKKSRGEFEGIDIPFSDIREDINSFEWGHITGIFARPGAKKTFLMAYWLAWIAITKDLNVLIYSSEMGQAELEERILAMIAGVNYDELTKGKLKQAEFKKLNAFLKSERCKKLQKHLFIAGPTSVKTLADLEIHCGERNIKVLGIDNAHTIQAAGNELHNKMNNLMMDMKLMTMRQQMHVVYTTHQNRYGGRGMSGMAYGDAFNTWSSNLFNLKPYSGNVIEISTPKVRNGRGGMKYKIEFDLYRGIIQSLSRREIAQDDAEEDDDAGGGSF
jgi:hypothetical protein